VAFRFTGKLDKLTLKIDRPKLTADDEKRLREAQQRNNRTSEYASTAVVLLNVGRMGAADGLFSIRHLLLTSNSWRLRRLRL